MYCGSQLVTGQISVPTVNHHVQIDLGGCQPFPADCAAAANPVVTGENQRQCVECLLKEVNGGIAQTILIPTTPVPPDANVALLENAFTKGVALNAIPLSAPAGIDDDGYGIYGRLDANGNEYTALDECLGETDDTRGYHFRAANLSENRIIACFNGETTGELGGGGPPPR